MVNRPLTDYLITFLENEDKSLSDPSLLPDITVMDMMMEENAREFASALNSLLGRIAISEDDIKLIIEQAKKESRLR